MAEPIAESPTIDAFIARWSASAAAERANYQLFLSEPCDLIEVPRPEPTCADDTQNAYVFERAVVFKNPDGTTSQGRIDLYKRGCFVLEAKQGSDQVEKIAEPLTRYAGSRRRGTAVRGTKGWDDAMMAARGQAEQYVRALPTDEGNPPFVVVVDVGHSIELYSDFSRSGKTYVPFPDATRHRIPMADLAREDVRTLLRALWTDPMSLDPSRRSAKVTREVADRLAALARSLESSGHAPEAVAQFLMRCIFTMFAEDVQLVPERAFTSLLERLRDSVDVFPDSVRTLWSEMDRGGFSATLQRKLPRFNGGLFESVDALPLTKEQLELLINAGRADWHDVEPAIFGTLLERALDPIERHKLGAHYTPRAYVERLVMPTIVEPLREEWDAVRAAAMTHMKSDRRTDAVEELRTFHRRLCDTKVLDPACGTGNFLYVTLEHLKRLEGEVLDHLRQLGERDTSLELTELTVDPHQLLGIEINPRAAAIADLVLWIGYLQWHFRTHGDAMPREPVLHKYNNIECRDALLEYDAVEPQLDDAGRPVTRWDGRTTKKHPVTGKDVPDETAQVPVMRYVNPRKAEWPEAEFIVGNPPFVGTALMRQALGVGYTTAVREIYRELPESIDFVMYWWHRAAGLVREAKVRRFGFIATNSLRQTFNRRVIAGHMLAATPLTLVYAIPDHPWIDSTQGAAVRISLTAAERGASCGTLDTVSREVPSVDGVHDVILLRRRGAIQPDLSIGANVTSSVPLTANLGLSSRGVQLIGDGFLVTREDAMRLGVGRRPGLEQHVRPYRNGRDLTSIPRGLFVIDLYGVKVEDVRRLYPEVHQWVTERVKPHREQNNRQAYRNAWWVFGEPRGSFRPALEGLPRYIVTVETSKYRFFVFLHRSILPDNKLVCIALCDAGYLGVLSSRVHAAWASASGSQLGPTPVYVKSVSFEAFPFAALTGSPWARCRDLAEQLDAHRKRQQELHPTLTITDMYNVLEKLRSGEPLTANDKKVHEQGLVSVLKEVHDELDRAVLEAYGWADLIPLLAYEHREEFEQQVLERLVALNHERAEEEKRGIVRWLRPEFQAPKAEQSQLDVETEPKRKVKKAETEDPTVEKQPWPTTMKEQAQAVRGIMSSSTSILDADQVARRFTGARVDRVREVLETLAALGAVREVEEGRYVA